MTNKNNSKQGEYQIEVMNSVIKQFSYKLHWKKTFEICGIGKILMQSSTKCSNYTQFFCHDFVRIIRWYKNAWSLLHYRKLFLENDEICKSFGRFATTFIDDSRRFDHFRNSAESWTSTLHVPSGFHGFRGNKTVWVLWTQVNLVSFFSIWFLSPTESYRWQIRIFSRETITNSRKSQFIGCFKLRRWPW